MSKDIKDKLKEREDFARKAHQYELADLLKEAREKIEDQEEWLQELTVY